jgi:dodecin
LLMPKIKIMPIVKVIEVISSSEKGIEDAIQNALTETSRTIKNIDSIFVKDIKVHVQDNQITTYGLICKVSFRIDSEEQTSNQ